MSQDIVDVLVYSSMKNNISPLPNDDILTKATKVPDIMRHTTIKRGCCRFNAANTTDDTKIEVDVRLPGEHDPDSEHMERKFGYIDKTVNFKAGMCKLDAKPYIKYDINEQCDKFMDIYCANIHKEYADLAGDKYNPFEFARYKPECACYVDPNKVPGVLDIPGMDGNPQCWFKPCTYASAYLKPGIRKGDGTADKCKLDILQCINEQNITVKDASGGVGIATEGNKQVNNCVKTTQKSKKPSDNNNNDDDDDDDDKDKDKDKDKIDSEGLLEDPNFKFYIGGAVAVIVIIILIIALS
jgi:hypothetical protein